MRRHQLEHAIRTACQIIHTSEVIVVGSQAILGTYREDELPAAATMSVEVDILPIAADNQETARLADLIEGVAGELSPFEQLDGYSIDGVDLDTSVLPASWHDRLVRVQNANPRQDPAETACSTAGTHRVSNRLGPAQRHGEFTPCPPRFPPAIVRQQGGDGREPA